MDKTEKTMNTEYEDPDRPILLASFLTPDQAERMAILLRSEEVECYVQNLYSNNIMGGYVDNGGVRIEVPLREYEHAVKVLEANGIRLPGDEETPAGSFFRWFERFPFMKNAPLEKRLWVLFFLTLVAILLLACIIHFSGIIIPLLK
ncbi:putative signal transducing protein [Porphyromonas macacae]|nr:DUF2007 domain-containing protein [Porphyromonas macacae]